MRDFNKIIGLLLVGVGLFISGTAIARPIDKWAIGASGIYSSAYQIDPKTSSSLFGGKIYAHFQSEDPLTLINIDLTLINGSFLTTPTGTYIDSYTGSTVEYSYSETDSYLPINLGIYILRQFDIYTPPKGAIYEKMPVLERLWPFAGGGMTIVFLNRNTTIEDTVGNHPPELNDLIGENAVRWLPMVPALTAKGGLVFHASPFIDLTLDASYSFLIIGTHLHDRYINHMFVVSLGIAYRIGGPSYTQPEYGYTGMDPIDELDTEGE